MRSFILFPLSLLLILGIALPASAAELEQSPRIGLVLSGGGARGIAHIGVLKVLEEMHIPVHYVTGTSMGSIVGSLYSAGYSPAELEEIVTTTDWPEAFDDDTAREKLSFRRKEDDLNFLTAARFGLQDGGVAIPAGFIQGQKLNLLLRRLLIKTTDVADFDALHLPFRAVSTNLIDGREVVHASGDLATAVRASMSIPGAFQPVELNGMLLVDGMLVNNIPIGLAFEMGADIVIAVDVGTPLRTKDELSSVGGVADQVLSIATDRMANIQRDQLRERDLLIVPALEGYGAADFELGHEIVPIGERAANGFAQRLSDFSVSDADWAAYLMKQRHGGEEVPIIDRVEFTNDSTIRDEVILARLEDQTGKPLDIDGLEEDIGDVHGSAIFQRVDYSLDASGEETVLKVEAHEKSWGPHYLRIGINLEENFDNTSVYNLAFNYTMNPVNELGGEWRNEFQIGDTMRVFTELWQPIDNQSKWFIAPSFEFIREKLPRYQGQERVGEFASRRTELGFDFGRQLSNWGEIRVGARWEDGRSGPVIGARSFQGSDVDGGGFYVRFAADTLDDTSFPTKGVFSRVVFGALRDSLGSNGDSELASLRFTYARSWGKQTILFSANGATQFGRTSGEIDDLTRVGGFLNLSGLDRDQLTGPHSLVARLITYRRLADLGVLSFRYPVYLGASVEMGNVWDRRGDISVGSAILGGSVFLGWSTPLGPLYFGYGVAEGGNESAYLFLGRTF
jgi:NTE family protein